MTNRDVHSTLVKWLASLTGVTAIKAYQGGKEPALPYIMVNLTGVLKLHDRPQEVDYVEAGDPAQITATPVNDAEWRFSVHAYGDNPTDILRPFLSACQLPQIQEPLLPDFFIHDVSQIRSVPEWINNAWQPRAQMDIVVHGLIKDGFVIDVIEHTSFDISSA